jgi:ketosteroid isomerase-like protein
MRIAAATFAVFACAACSHNTIPGTNIPDQPENRAVLDVVAAYKAAMEARDPDAVLNLAAPNYFDKGDPNKQSTGPLDYGTLRREIPEDFKDVKSVHLDITVRDVQVEGDKARVDYYAVLRYAISVPTGEKWFSEADDARMRLVKINGRWKITSGL